MTTHARGAIYLDPAARSALDVGALHGRAISIDERGKVLSYKMTSREAVEAFIEKRSPVFTDE